MIISVLKTENGICLVLEGKVLAEDSSALIKYLSSNAKHKTVVIDMKNVDSLDMIAGRIIRIFGDSMKKGGRKLSIINVPERVKKSQAMPTIAE